MPSDPFPAPQSRVPADVFTASVTVQISGNPVPSYDYTYKYEVLDARGRVVDSLGGDVTPHITSAQKGKLTAIINAAIAGMRASIP